MTTAGERSILTGAFVVAATFLWGAAGLAQTGTWPGSTAVSRCDDNNNLVDGQARGSVLLTAL